MEQLDKEVIDELSEPAKRVFRSLDYRSQRRMLKKAKEMGKQKSKKRKSRRKREAVLLREIKVELPLLLERKLKILLHRYCRLCFLEQQ